MHDIKQKGVWRKVKIVDRTHTNGIPTFLNMERQLYKVMK